jgi:hypothetical protein
MGIEKRSGNGGQKAGSRRALACAWGSEYEFAVIIAKKRHMALPAAVFPEYRIIIIHTMETLIRKIIIIPAAYPALFAFIIMLAEEI